MVIYVCFPYHVKFCLHIFQLLFNWSLLNIVSCMNSKVGVSFSSTFQATIVNLHKLVQHLVIEEFYNKAKSGIIELFVKALWKVYGCKWASLGDFSTCCSTFFFFSFLILFLFFFFFFLGCCLATLIELWERMLATLTK